MLPIGAMTILQFLVRREVQEVRKGPLFTLQAAMTNTLYAETSVNFQ